MDDHQLQLFARSAAKSLWSQAPDAARWQMVWDGSGPSESAQPAQQTD